MKWLFSREIRYVSHSMFLADDYFVEFYVYVVESFLFKVVVFAILPLVNFIVYYVVHFK